MNACVLPTALDVLAVCNGSPDRGVLTPRSINSFKVTEVEIFDISAL
ncbi:hypothetical protein [Deinococcus detaillensis]|nr:hypothetical protein [Deinococcus detaillensis]